MNAKRLFSSAILMLAICSVASAQQRLDIIHKDRTMSTITLDNINYMEIVQSAGENEIDGIWYLGWKVASSSTSNSNGEEMLVFTASRMRWMKKYSESVYTLEYDEAGPVPGTAIKAHLNGGSAATTYVIYANDGEVLVLQNGTTKYYFYKTKAAAIAATKPSSSNYLSRQQYATGEDVWNADIKGGSSHSNSTPMGKHFESYRAATDDDKAWLANPDNQPDENWLEISGSNRTWRAATITLYPMTSSPSPADVNQHGIGNCCMCAVLASFAYNYPMWIKSIIEKDGNNYTVHMFDPKGNPVDVVVDNKVFANSSGDIFQVAGKNSKYDWATILEKALMKWESCFHCNKIGGIGTEHAAPPFTGNGDSFSFDWGDRLYNAEYPMVAEYALDNGMICVGGFHESGVMMGELESVTGHAFTVMKATDADDCLFVMRNPWGNEPAGSSVSNRTDGKLKIPNDHQKLRLIDFRFVFPGAQMAQYKKENLGGYTPPRYNATYDDMNPSEAMLRMYNVRNYVPVFPEEEEPVVDDAEAEE
ncbi:MAG: hypothetical protein J6W03_01140 [Bacteroidaceae bacterium]|nr:hypothetical protein [Bacteroidaceae bacterium]